jgi:hypothetical protein
MPILIISTNLPESKIPIKFDVFLAQKIHELLAKPLEYCCVQIHSGQIINFGGSYILFERIA